MTAPRIYVHSGDIEQAYRLVLEAIPLSVLLAEVLSRYDVQCRAAREYQRMAENATKRDGGEK